VPVNWKKAAIVPLHKKKYKMDCNNYRRISLLSHSCKVYSGLILSRFRMRKDEILAEETGLRACGA